MTLRTYKQLGQAYGSNPVTLVAKLDGVEVFNGTLTTLDQPLPSMPIAKVGLGWGTQLFSWTEDIAYTGSKALEITVTGGTLLLSNTVANYIGLKTWGTTSPGPGEPGYYPDAPPPGNPSAVNQALIFGPYSDPKNILSNCTINGQDMSNEPNSNPALTGQWFWTLHDGSVFTATVLQTAGIE